MSLQLPRPSLSFPNLTALKSSLQDQDEAGDEETVTEIDEEFDTENYAIDVDALDEEAKDAVREYSTSLSSELKMGAGLPSLFNNFECINKFLMNKCHFFLC